MLLEMKKCGCCVTGYSTEEYIKLEHFLNLTYSLAPPSNYIVAKLLYAILLHWQYIVAGYHVILQNKRLLGYTVAGVHYSRTQFELLTYLSISR